MSAESRTTAEQRGWATTWRLSPPQGVSFLCRQDRLH